jgi:serine-aspartate repeat-containing protein C/D/E
VLSLLVYQNEQCNHHYLNYQNDSLGDYVWLDTNKDGKQDDTEKGIPGVTVTLKDKDGNVLQTTTTECNHHYLNYQNDIYLLNL